jgi:plasmid rolling circle replication initiator protein Rep
VKHKNTLSQKPSVVKAPALSEMSEKDAKWDKHRSNTQTIGSLYDRAGEGDLERLGKRMASCSGVLKFGQAVNLETGEISIKLDQAFFCKVRHCPVCQWRRGMANMAKFYERLPAVSAAYPQAQWLFLTLTVKNPEMADLRTTLRDMNAAWQRMIQRAGWPAKGFIRTTEVTKGKDGNPHPHFHALLLVSPGYFQGKNYISQVKWAQMWRDALRADYTPVVHVAKVKAKSDKAKAAEASGDKIAALSAAVAETLKYSVKPEDMLTDGAFLFGITKQLFKLRFLATGGLLKGWLKETASNAEMVETGLEDEEEKEAEVRPDLPPIFFGWKKGERRYRQVKKGDGPKRSYEISPRAPELGGGWRLRLIEDGEEVGGGVFPPVADIEDAEQAFVSAFENAKAEATSWLDSRP